MKNYIIVDYMNLAFRAKHAQRAADLDMQIGLAMHIIFNGIKNVYNKFSGSHVVICTEGTSWRKEYYSGYKKNRVLKQIQKPIEEQEDDELFLKAMVKLEEYLTFNTNVSVLKCPVAEGDDMVSIFIDCHPEDNHYIISADTDFFQLLAPNVTIYNGITEETITLDGVFDLKGNPVIDKKTQKPKVVEEPEYLLFEKCIRGDTSDNIFSAYPNIRTANTKNKIGIKGAYEDRHTKGYDWNNFMQSEWKDADGNTHVVQDKYEFNRRLIDLRMQPKHIREQCEESMALSLAKEPVSSPTVGINFLKFCSTWGLDRISKTPTEYAKILSRRYEL